ncbi:MAG: gliding motility-associated C-terminal domain-containing protein [Bacteroidia bacterium]|nr:gliding motility-associated C-terminal domain-containing protein [Bacteroidia bacterium]
MQLMLPVLMRYSRVGLSLIAMMVVAVSHVFGTHAMGSDLTYRCLGGNTYEITLTIYRDCVGSALTPMQNISISSSSCGVAPFVLQAPRVSLMELSPLCPIQQPLSTCNGGPLPGIEEHIYRTTYTFPQACPDWKLSWQLCCRNYAITNSVITPTTRMYIEAFLNNQISPCNSSPYFTVPPVPYICNGQPFSYNNGAVDDDGDSLVFELVDPLDFVYTGVGGVAIPVPYVGGFNANYPMATNPPNNFSFDQFNGQISFTPSGLQQGIVALLVKEYRNGVLIGTTMRDLQMVVINCANTPPSISPPFNITGGQYNGNTFSVCAGNTLSFDVIITDPDAFNIISVINTVAQAIPGAVVTISGTNPVTVNFSWPTTVADIGNYFYTLSATDDGCPIVGKSVSGYNIVVQTGEILPTTMIQICPGTTSTVALNSGITTPPGGTYSWTPATGVTNPNIQNTTGLVDSASLFTVTYTPPFGCPIVKSFEVMPEAELVLSVDSVDICSGDTVQLQTSFTFNGPPVSPPTYTWIPTSGLSNPFSPNPLAFPSTTTTYTVNVSTLTCTYSADLQVQVSDVPILSPIPSQGICQGDSALVVVQGTNIAGVNYQWSPILGVSDPNSGTVRLSPQVSTTYTVTASNACGSDVSTVFIDVAAPIQLIPSFTNITCNGDGDGAATMVVTGGAGTNDFTWMPNVGVGPTIGNLPPGPYQVTVQDLYGCKDTVTFVISEPPPLIIASQVVVDVTCHGGSNGSITITAGGGTPGYEYSIDGGTTWLSITTFNNLSAGTYTILLRDDNGCLLSSPPIVVTQPAVPVGGILVSKIDTDCNNAFGQINVTGTGGTAPYQYSFNGGPFSSVGLFTNLNPGFYNVTVEDSLGCDTTLGIEVYQIANPYATLDTFGNVSCFGGNDGFIQISGSSGTPPYTFSFNGGPLQTGSSFTSLTAGNYVIFLFDSIGCRYDLNVNITEPDSLYNYLGNYQNTECFGDSSGALLVLAQGGTPPYQFSIDGVNYGTGNFFTKLPQGPYTLYVQDANGCIATTDTSISGPPPVVGAIANLVNPLCFGDLNGQVELTATGGTPPYLYSLDGQIYFQNNFFGNLGIGTYSYFVQDANGCVDMIDVTITQPPLLLASVTNVVDVLCYETASGQITVSASGGTPPYLYSPDGGITYSADNTLAGLEIGFYTVLIQDVNGCLVQVDTAIVEPNALTADIVPIPVTCPGDSNGIAEVTTSGGTAPYTYLWSTGATQARVTGLGPGNYLVVITDENDCQIAVSTEIFEPPAIENDSLVFTDASCFGDFDGTAAIAVSGGSPPFSFSWSNGSVDSLVTTLGAGQYTVTVTDTTGCNIIDTVDIAEPPQIESELIDAADAFCSEPNGFITIEASGGVGGFNYQWNLDSIQLGPSAIRLFGDTTYLVVVTDSNGCAASFTYEIGSDPRPIADFIPEFFPADSFIIKTGKEVAFINRSLFAIAYFWDFSDGGFSDEVNPSHAFRDTGTYEVMLVAWDPNFACPDTAIRRFTLLPPGAIYVPNAFSPNDDGNNDTWAPDGIGIIWVKTRIYSRWGIHIRTLDGLPDRWDGTFEGADVQEGVYVYVVDALINDGTRFTKSGTVTLFR